MTARYPANIVTFAQAEFHKTNNLGNTTLAADITGSPTTFSLTSASTVTTWPTANFMVRIENELIFVSSRSSTTCTIGARAMGGTSAVNHTGSPDVRVVFTSEFIQQMAEEIVGMQGWTGMAASLVHASVTTTPYTATASDGLIPVDATSASATINLPTAASITGKMYVIIKTDSTVNTVTVDASGSETIGGALTAVLRTQNSTAIVYSNGTNWYLVSSGGSGGLVWIEVTGTSQTASVNSGYILNNAALVTLTLPSTASLGDLIGVVGKGAGGWRIAQNANQIIHFGNADSTTGTSGRLDSTHRRDSLELVCVVSGSSTEWNVRSSVGVVAVT